jgi:hypothetical protein
MFMYSELCIHDVLRCHIEKDESHKDAWENFEKMFSKLDED